MGPLAIVLSNGATEMQATYRNIGSVPIALTFWWNERLRVTRDDLVITPGPGPVLPCGVGEDWTVIAPGAMHTARARLACTQPAGERASIGWSYDLAPGTYRVTLIYEAPPAHGFVQSDPHPRAFRGSVTSNEIDLVVAPKPGLLDRLLGR